MKILIRLSTLFAVLTACSTHSIREVPENLILDGVITVHVKSAKQVENISLKLGTYHSFPQHDVSMVQDTLTYDKNEIYLKGPCRNLGQSYLHVGDSTFIILGAPGDTINVLIQADSGKTPSSFRLSFEGKTKEIQEYYLSKTKLLKDPVQECMNLGMNSMTLRPFQYKMDKSYEAQRKFLENFHKANQLPDWFIEYETNVLNYTDAWLRGYMVWYQITYQKKMQVIPESYYEFESRVRIKNEAIMYQYEYLRFLRDYLFGQMRQSNKTLGLDNLVDYARKELGDDLGSFFEIWERSGAVDNPNWVDTKFQKQFPSRHQYLIDYVQHRAKSNIKLLKSGDKAPNFALVDVNDSLVTLNQYKGQIIYISFWFTTCGPCIQEIPYENKLVERFKDKPVKIISICTGTPGLADDKQIAKWRATSERFGLKTIDLFSNRSWTNTLTENYKISVYPHYVLIGADGNVIENFTDRPSQNIAFKIEKALEHIDK